MSPGNSISSVMVLVSYYIKNVTYRNSFQPNVIEPITLWFVYEEYTIMASWSECYTNQHIRGIIWWYRKVSSVRRIFHFDTTLIWCVVSKPRVSDSNVCFMLESRLLCSVTNLFCISHRNTIVRTIIIRFCSQILHDRYIVWKSFLWWYELFQK